MLAARAFNRVYDLKLSVRGEMDLAYHGEITTPSQCGRMDQCCAFGARPVLMTFDGDRLDCDELSLGGTLCVHASPSGRVRARAKSLSRADHHRAPRTMARAVAGTW